jgi:hypothetical protein
MIVNKQYVGRSCVVWLQENVERIVPLSATDRAEKPFTTDPFPISLLSVRQLLAAYEHAISQLGEGKDGETHRSVLDFAADNEASSGDSDAASGR